MASDEEMAHLQRLSNDYEPNVQGPLVGQRQSSQAIIAELKSLNNLLNSTGYKEDLYIDFVEATLDLLEHTSANLPCQDDGAALLESFNDEGVAGPIIAHFRLITSAWMKTHADVYKDFLLGQTVEEYCSSHIDPFRVEIDNQGLNALIDAIIKPAGMAVDVLYLDLSPGEEVNIIRWEPDSLNRNTGFGTPTIRLLYRPGHYDILYAPEDLASLPLPTFSNPQVNLMSDPVMVPTSNALYPTHHELDVDNYFIPGLSTAGISDLPFSADFYQHTTECSPGDNASSSPASEQCSAPVFQTMPSLPTERTRDGIFRKCRFNLEEEFFHKTPPVQMEPCQTDAMKQ
ncbi:MAG: hypothetical protein LQ342_003608 [Letrouitia transgressa]|nr:MAG: hypothetical protein LQ342_003608 [Letrouitia transgressa]